MTSVEMSFKEEDLKFYFVVEDGVEDVAEMSIDMRRAHTTLKQYCYGESMECLPISECIKINGRKLTKKDVFILEEFTGEVFTFLESTKCLLVGPRCIISCIIENAPVPLGSSPIFTTVMRNLQISASGFSTKEKKEIKRLITWMGGYYTDDLNANCTHLVCNTVKSSKYEQSGIRQIAIMTADWVTDAWERSKIEFFSANTEDLIKKYRLPIFHTLTFTASGLSTDKKNKIMKLINENGGNFVGTFKSSVTDVVIVEANGVNSEKYKAAIRFKKDCLLPEWITDSIMKGYALPFGHYRVSSMKVSTPTRFSGTASVSDFNPDSTELSVISHVDKTRESCSIEESICSATSSIGNRKSATLNSAGTQQVAYKEVLNKISTQQARKAGTFLDGCSIFLAGFSASEREKINKIINSGGATRFDEINDKVTHILVGHPTPAELKKITENGNCGFVVKLEWLAASLKEKQPVNEDAYTYRARLPILKEPETPSPSSKKNIKSMNYSFKKPLPPKIRLFDEDGPEANHIAVPEAEEDSMLLSQYTKENSSSMPVPEPNCKNSPAIPVAVGVAEPPPRPTTETEVSEMCTEDYQNLTFFEGFSVHLHNHTGELYQQLQEDCEVAGGKVVSSRYRDVVDYVIVPTDTATDLQKIPVKSRNIVNVLWLDDAIKVNERIPTEYYHKPIPVTADAKPLKGFIFVISLYALNERIFIESLGTVLGAESNENYAKKQKPILICPKAEGSKYNAAIKWNFPVVTSQWLLTCAEKGERVDFEPFLVGESVATWTSFDISVESSRNRTYRPQTAKPKTRESKKQSEIREEDIPRQPEFVENCDPANNDIADEDNEVFLAPQALDVLNPIRHKRLSELAGPSRRDSSPSGTPTTPTNNPDSPSPFNISDFCNEISTPNRDIAYKMLKEFEQKETPRSQRLRNMAATPGNEKTPTIPTIEDFCTTPEIKKQRLERWSKYYGPKKETRKSTPLSEIKRTFWKDMLGEHYWDPKNYNTQAYDESFDEGPGPSNRQSSAAGITTATVTSNRPIQPPAVETKSSDEANANLQELQDFIKNRTLKKIPFVLDEDCLSVPTHQDGVESENFLAGTEQMVQWRDPSEFIQSRRSRVNVMKFQGTPVFSISSTEGEQARKRISDQIVHLKGKICANLNQFDSSCTHMVCERPNRGEKILSCIAAGKYILGLKYIEDSYEAGYFLDEESYEWGNPIATNLPKFDGMESSLAKAAYRWRTKIAQSNECSFHGFRVILHVPNVKAFANLITAGSGSVLEVKEPYAKSEKALTATHCFVDSRKMKLSQTDHQALSSAGVLVLNINYISSHLTDENPIDQAKYLLNLSK